MPSFDPPHVPKPMMARPIEVITCRERRRQWDPEVRAAIMMEALEPGAVISQVARRHDMGPQQLFGWLREARKGAEANAASFVPGDGRGSCVGAGAAGAQAPDSPAALARGAH